MPDGFALVSGSGLGHQLVTMMAGQVGATIETTSHGGTCITVMLPFPAEET